ncbi:MAG: aminopeptidase P family protein [Bacteroidales bacterium]|nr:aminopeptidase P family protein [Bacteroidales bacterium]
MKHSDILLDINLLGNQEQALRLNALTSAMVKASIPAAIVRTAANIYYLTGRVFRGFIYIAPGQPLRYFLRQPTTLRGDNIYLIRKPEDIPAAAAKGGFEIAPVVAQELGDVTFSDAMRVAKALGAGAPSADVTPLLKQVRSVKTDREQELLRISGQKQSMVYERIPGLYREGMSDIEFQIEIERASRLEGCLGQFRVAGADMEIFMGNVLTGDNADAPSPYDFAMGGAGLDPSIPVGADGTIIVPGVPVMVDVNGNYTGYMTDMTRCFAAGEVSDKVKKAHQLSIDICDELQRMMIPGAKACDLYKRAEDMAHRAGMADYFMGHRSHAGFVGHGVGIEINELPVIAPRSKNVLEAGNVIALEPKFVLPHIGAVGIENTYIVREDAPAEVITTAPREIVQL